MWSAPEKFLIIINKIKTTFGSPTNQTSTQQVRSIAEYSYYS